MRADGGSPSPEVGRRGLASLGRSQPSWMRRLGRASGRGDRPEARGREWTYCLAADTGEILGNAVAARAVGVGPSHARGRLRARAPGGSHRPRQSGHGAPGSGRAGSAAHRLAFPSNAATRGAPAWLCCGPIESQRGHPSLPQPASPSPSANSKCPSGPLPATPSGDLEMRSYGVNSYRALGQRWLCNKLGVSISNVGMSACRHVGIPRSLARALRARRQARGPRIWTPARRTRSSSRRAVSTAPRRQLGEQLDGVAAVGAEIALTLNKWG